MDAAILAIGIDIGGSFTKIALVDQSANLSRLEVIETASHGGVEGYFSKVEEIVSTLLDEHPIGIGITLPGFLTDDGRRITYNPNTPALEGIDFVAHFSRFGLPVKTEQDLNAPAISEYYYGAGRGTRRFMATPIGTGVGVGMIVDGQVLRFTGYTTGDAGHIILEPDGPACTGGCRGCAEALITVPAIERDSLAALASGEAESLRKYFKQGRIPAQSVIQAAREGDPSAVKIMTRIARRVGLWLASLAPIFLPERIALCGGIAEAGSFFLDTCRQRFLSLTGPAYSEHCEIVLGTFCGLAGVVGAAAPFLMELQE
ncbi:MAG: ROK family protein [Chloroflexota bacterium]